MTTRIDQLPREREVDDIPPTVLPDTEGTHSIRRASLVAGIGILVIAALAVFGDVFVVEGLVTPGDAARTATDVMASEGLFRLGVLSLYLVVALDVVVAWALFRVFAPVSEGSRGSGRGSGSRTPACSWSPSASSPGSPTS